jgi:HEPN domain-containing protein
MLREVGVDPPHWHDVGGLLQEHRVRLAGVDAEIDQLAAISAWLRKEREFAFSGEIDLIPTERYSEADAIRARHDAETVVRVAGAVIAIPPAEAR